MSERPESILLDMDDTMIDVTRSYRQATIATVAAFGKAVTLEDITETKAAGGANDDWELTHRLLVRRGVDVPLAEVIRVFESLYQGEDGRPGMKERETLLVEPAMLERWSRVCKLGIVTGRPRSDAEWFLDRHGIRHLFRAVVTMDDGPMKPDPAPVRKALEDLGSKDGWMVGDTPDDVRAAVAAGIVAIGVIAPADDPGIARAALSGAGAWRVVERLPEIDGWI
jgi:HAD superfamily hydrolase (TIGR01548 family)